MDNSTFNEIKEQLGNLKSNEKKVIFGNIQYNNEDDFVSTIKSMSLDDKLIIIKTILEHNYYKGHYSLIESEFISCLLRYL